MENVYILDAGHFLNTPGKRSPDDSLREHAFNHPTAQALGAILKSYQNTSVFYVYDKNKDTPLKARTDRANKIYSNYAAKVKVGTARVFYISIHANAIGTGWNTAEGIETFVYETRPADSVALANSVHKSLIAATGRDDRGVKAANFHVLRETNMPSILVECGFMTNKAENELLKSPVYRQKVAQGIANGLVAHSKLIPIKATEAPVEAAAAPAKEVNTKMSQTPNTAHADAVKWAKENNISDGSNPQEPATREQVIQMIYNDNKRKGSLK